ncbi:lysylphosphatidylglycerol synthase transmembrane domain-containing protein [Halonotius roseus]|uniref:Flippase-like domain-containing protein n=1 Tax=Halonotius roseus TaxID=2511997 RepID=A0A544QNN1_9EURY|nr:lysylphosphatidylglycerol synthase transmembrane domain-containing protein [Halonotius roseus]TQQ80529.1 flippase-like domain-containing protein [Halonotius roseus]
MTNGDDPDDRGGLRALLTRRRLTIGGTVLVVAGLLFAFREVEFDRVVGEMAAADPWLLAAAVGVYAASWPLRGRRYGDVLTTTGHPLGTAFLTLAVFLSQTANLVVPARGGDAVRAYVLRARRNVPYPAGFASLAVERGFDLAAIAVLGAGATAWLLSSGDPATLTAVTAAGDARTAMFAATGVAAATLAAGLLTLVVANANRSRSRRLGRRLRETVAGRPRLQRVVAAGLDFVGDIAVVARNPRAVAIVGGGSLLIWSLDVATAVLVLAALDSGLAVGSLLAVGTLAVSVGNLAKVLPLSQGGVGLYEAAFTGLVVALTPLGASLALAAAVVDHALKNAVTLVGGGVAVAVLGIDPSTAARRGSDADAGGDTAAKTTAADPAATTAAEPPVTGEARADGSGEATSSADD